MMNAAHLHLVLNHFPVIGASITLFVLIIGIIKKSDDVKKVSVLILLLTALITIPVYLSGEKAGGKVEGNYEDVDEQFIDAHEDFAYYSFIFMNISGVIALISMFVFKKPKTLPDSFSYLFLVILLIVMGMMAYTANLGGKIHHPEIREDKLPWESSTQVNPGNTKNMDGKNEKKDADKNEDEKDDD